MKILTAVSVLDMGAKTMSIVPVLVLMTISVTQCQANTHTPDIDQTEKTSCKVTLDKYTGDSNVTPTIPKSHLALLTLVGFAGFSILVSLGYKSLRKHVYKDAHNLDTVFDAGGRVSVSLTAVTVTSQMLWPADFVLFETLISRSGLGGALWISIGIIFLIILFPLMSLYIKTRAPGAKTYLQIVYARFGTATHIMFCVLAFMSNLVISTAAMLAGRTAIQVLSKDTNNEFVFLIIAVLFGCYCLIGGLGTTFYVSYLNTAITYLSVTVYIIYTSFYPSPETEDVSLPENVYNHVACIAAPDSNYDNSFFTFRSRSGVIYGVVFLFMATSNGFCDQANWQSRIAAKPTQGILGFYLAAFLWFILPLTLSFTVTTSYLSMSAINGTHLLSDVEIDNGYITPYVMDILLGKTGSYLFLTMMMMSMMSTGSGEVMGISSIIIYDIYKTYVNPYRKLATRTSCVLCGKEKALSPSVDNVDGCKCPSVIGCEACSKDVAQLQTQRNTFGVQYSCPTHGQYRHYEDVLMRYKTWCMIWLAIGVVPLGLLISETSVNVTWVSLGFQTLTGPFLVPIILTITWAKATAQGIIAGSVSGIVCSMSAMLIAASQYDGGLGNFFVNTIQDFSLLASLSSGLLVSGSVAIVVSLCTTTIKNESDEKLEWAKTINIDNPLNPFRLIYSSELKDHDIDRVITTDTMEKIFKRPKYFAFTGSVVSVLLFIVVVPASILSIDVLNLDQFKTWILTFQYLCFAATFIAVVLPPVEEGVQIWKQYKQNNRKEIPNIHLLKQTTALR